MNELFQWFFLVTLAKRVQGETSEPNYLQTQDPISIITRTSVEGQRILLSLKEVEIYFRGFKKKKGLTRFIFAELISLTQHI